MTTLPATTRRLLFSGLIIALILTAAIILDGPPTLTNKVVARGELTRSGNYYGSYCSPYCTYLPVIVRQFVMRSHYTYLPVIIRELLMRSYYTYLPLFQ